MTEDNFTKEGIKQKDFIIRIIEKAVEEEEANDLLQETSLKALDNEEKYTQKR